MTRQPEEDAAVFCLGSAPSRSTPNFVDVDTALSESCRSCGHPELGPRSVACDYRRSDATEKRSWTDSEIADVALLLSGAEGIPFASELCLSILGGVYRNKRFLESVLEESGFFTEFPQYRTSVDQACLLIYDMCSRQWGNAPPSQKTPPQGHHQGPREMQILAHLGDLRAAVWSWRKRLAQAADALCTAPEHRPKAEESFQISVWEPTTSKQRKQQPDNSLIPLPPGRDSPLQLHEVPEQPPDRKVTTSTATSPATGISPLTASPTQFLGACPPPQSRRVGLSTLLVGDVNKACHRMWRRRAHSELHSRQEDQSVVGLQSDTSSSLNPDMSVDSLDGDLHKSALTPLLAWPESSSFGRPDPGSQDPENQFQQDLAHVRMRLLAVKQEMVMNNRRRSHPHAIRYRRVPERSGRLQSMGTSPGPESPGVKERLSLSTRAVCTVCQDLSSDHALIPCGHLALCGRCARRLMEAPTPRCPQCRCDIVGYMRVFFS